MIDLKKVVLDEEIDYSNPNRKFNFMYIDGSQVRFLTADEAKEILELLWQYDDLRSS